MPVKKILNEIKNYHKLNAFFTHWEHLSAKNGIYENFPDWIDIKLMSVLIEKGIERI